MLGFRATKERLMQKIFHSLFGSTDNVIVGTKSSIQEEFQISDIADHLNGLGVR